MRSRKSNDDPPVKELRDAQAYGRLPDAYEELLRNDPKTVAMVAHELLDAHFPPSVHGDILDAVGLALRPMDSADRVRRDPDFRVEVLEAYEHRCAMCGYDAQLDGRPVGLEAAHVCWHSHGGPSVVNNGLAVCPLHHKAFDLGLVGISHEGEVLVSPRVTGGPRVDELLIKLAGQPLMGPQPDVTHLDWHHKEVFKSSERTSGTG